jgi:hypothetical protein
MVRYQRLKRSSGEVDDAAPVIISQSYASVQTQPHSRHNGVKHFRHLVTASHKITAL